MRSPTLSFEPVRVDAEGNILPKFVNGKPLNWGVLATQVPNSILTADANGIVTSTQITPGQSIRRTDTTFEGFIAGDLSSSQTFVNKDINCLSSINHVYNIPLNALQDFETSTLILTNPGADRVVYWHSSLGRFDWLDISSLGGPPSDIVGFMGTAAVRGMAGTVSIGVRTDNKPGSGTPEDPFDGSTAAKFDAIINASADGTHFHLVSNNNATPTVFLTKGFQGAGIDPLYEVIWPGQVTVTGDGPNRTILRLSQFPSGFFAAYPGAGRTWVVMGSKSTAGNITLKDLTIDVNGSNLITPGTDIVISGFALAGSNNLTQNVRVTGTYGNAATSRECFSGAFTGLTSGSTNNWAIDCEILTPSGTYQNAFAFLGASAVHPMTQSGAIRCTAIGFFTSGMANLAHVDGLTFDHCYSEGCNGVYHDTGTANNISITHCRFMKIGSLYDGAQGVADVVSDQTDTGWSVLDCVLELQGGATFHNYGVNLSCHSQVNSRVSGNKFVRIATGANYRPLWIQNATGCVIGPNEFDPNFAVGLVDWSGTGISLVSNTDFNGIGMRGMADNLNVQTVSATSGTVQLNNNVRSVILTGVLTGTLTLTQPRGGDFTQFVVVDSVGGVNSPYTVRLGLYPSGGTINGTSGSIAIMNGPYQWASVTSDGIPYGNVSVSSSLDFANTSNAGDTFVITETAGLTNPQHVPSGTKLVLIDSPSPLTEHMYVGGLSHDHFDEYVIIDLHGRIDHDHHLIVFNPDSDTIINGQVQPSNDLAVGFSANQEWIVTSNRVNGIWVRQRITRASSTGVQYAQAPAQFGSFLNPVACDVWIGDHDGLTVPVYRIRTGGVNNDANYGFYLKTDYDSGGEAAIASLGLRNAGLDADVLTMKGTNVTFAGTIQSGSHTLTDGANVMVGTVTGTKIGTVGGASGQKLGVWGQNPITQPLLATGAGHTVDEVITVLQNIGWCRQS